MERIIDLSTDGLHISVLRGFLTVEKNREEVGRVPLDDIGGLITHAHGISWSNNVLVKLGERGVPVIICAANHAPISCLWPLQGHHTQGARLIAQAEAPKPLVKRLWKEIVKAKIRMQGAVLASTGAVEADAFDLLARRVRSGDPENLEAQAARRYWKALMGPVTGNTFRRDINADGANALLNYGYTVLRATVSRAICAAGLHPGLGLHHANRSNAFALSDDLMEPYRPFVDRLVFNLLMRGHDSVTPETKQALAALSALDLETDEGMSPLHVQVTRFVHSLVRHFEGENVALALPRLPSPLLLSSLGVEEQETGLLS